MKKYILSFLMLVVSNIIYAQGHIDHIKTQGYLQYKDKVNCNEELSDNLSEKICANLAFQEADSLLTITYNNLLLDAKTHHIDSLHNKVVQMQVTWRYFRDQHCTIIWDGYEGCGSCHQRSIDYLYCMKELTENRIRELNKLAEQL